MKKKKKRGQNVDDAKSKKKVTKKRVKASADSDTGEKGCGQVTSEHQSNAESCKKGKNVKTVNTSVIDNDNSQEDEKLDGKLTSKKNRAKKKKVKIGSADKPIAQIEGSCIELPEHVDEKPALQKGECRCGTNCLSVWLSPCGQHCSTLSPCASISLPDFHHLCMSFLCHFLTMFGIL